MTKLRRRQTLAGLGTAAIPVACGKREPSNAFFCANDPAISDPTTPLTIDVHTHVFNGSDLQVADFFKNVRAPNIPGKDLIAEILKELGRDFAPTARQELNALGPVEAALQNCDRARPIPPVLQ